MTSERYRLIKKVGSGAMADVYRAQDTEEDRQVAIKLLRGRAAKEQAARFAREVAVLQDLRHPGVVACYGAGEWEDGRPFMALEWLEGEDLKARIRRSPLGMRDAVEVVRRAAAAMAAIHSRGVVHRDLTLGNIWLQKGRGLNVKLLDFGVVSVPWEDGFRTQPGTIIGTPHFMAPEQAQGKPATPQTDIYALGAVLFKLLTGEEVFPTEHIVALLGRLVLEDPPKPSERRPAIPRGLDALVAKALARAPEARFGDAGSFARALARVGELSNRPPGEDADTEAPPSVHSPDESLEFQITQPRPRSVPPAMGMAERRVVATVVAQLSSDELPESLSQALKRLLRRADRLELMGSNQLVAALGVDRSGGDELLRAARCALLLVRELADVRVAIATGYAARNRERFSADALERAASQLKQAASGGIRVDPAALPLLRARFRLKEDAQGAVLLHEETTAKGRRKLLGIATPTVGRNRELAELLQHYGDCVNSNKPVAVFVQGHGGLGKSRLRYELVRHLSGLEKGPDMLICRGDPVRLDGSLSALGWALRQRFGIVDGAANENSAERIGMFVDWMKPEALPADEARLFLGELLGVKNEGQPSASLKAARQDPRFMLRQLRQVVAEFVRAQGAFNPQVIIVEDCHWVDELTLEILTWLLESSDLPLAVFAFGRPDGGALEHGFFSHKALNLLPLGPLALEACEHLVAKVLPGLAEPKRKAIAERAAGNGLFLEELIRSAGEGGEELPMSIGALVQRRLDSLSPEVRAVARAASVFGAASMAGGIEAILGRGAKDELGVLRETEILVPSGESHLAGQVRWVFHHSLVRDAIYDMLVDEDRERFHRAAGSWLEAHGEEDLATLAHHARLGNEPERAARISLRAVHQSEQRGNIEGVLANAQQGLLAAEDPFLRAELHLIRAHAFGWMGRFQDQAAAARQALSAYQPATTHWVRAKVALAASKRDQGDHASALQELDETLAAVDAKLLPPELLSLVHSTRARSLADGGDVDAARGEADLALDLALQAGEKGYKAKRRATDARFVIVATQGDLAEQPRFCRELLRDAEAAGDWALGTRARVNLGYSLNCIGQFHEAEEILRQAAKDARKLRVSAEEGFALHNLGMTLCRLGIYAEGIELQRHARQRAETMGLVRLTSAALQYEALGHIWRGEDNDFERAANLLERVLKATSTQPTFTSAALSLRAFLAERQGDYELCLEHCGQLVATKKPADLWEWEGLLHLAYARSLLAANHVEVARQVLQAARARLQSKSERLSEAARTAYLSNLAENRKLLTLCERYL